MIKGIKEIREKTQETQQMGQRVWINRLRIKDGETATLRFLTDVEEKNGASAVIQDLFHDIEEISPKGKRFKTKYCTMRDTGICQYCAAENGVKKYIFLWAYVHNILHKKQNPALEDDLNALRWSQVKVGSKIYFKEDVSVPMLFRTGIGKSGYIKNFLIQYADEYGTFCDRDYKWSRTGTTKDDTAYSLIPKDPSKMSKEMLEVKKNLPDLEKVAMGEIVAFGQTEEEPKRAEVVEENGAKESGEDLF